MGNIGLDPPSQQSRSSWVQTERAAHEAWKNLIQDAPMAAALMNVLVAQMDSRTNAVVASQGTLGELMARPGHKAIHRNTVRSAINKLRTDRWIEVVRLGGHGGALAYVINDRVAWSRGRRELRYSAFSARVVASESEQTEPLDDRPPLRQVPTLMRGEEQLPSGEGEDPPSQPSLDGLEPDLPAVFTDEYGREWEANPESGELQRRIESDDQE